VAPREALLAETLDGPVRLILQLPLPGPAGSNTPPNAAGTPGGAVPPVRDPSEAVPAGQPDPQAPSSRGPD
jgi:hypothetical protein